MNAHDYIQKVRDAGFSIALDGDRLLVSPIENLTPDQRQSLSDHKQEIIAALRSSESLLDAEGGHDLGVANDADVLRPKPRSGADCGLCRFRETGNGNSAGRRFRRPNRLLRQPKLQSS